MKRKLTSAEFIPVEPLTKDEFERLIETAHGNGGLFDPEQADA